ncbi:hypothetical protein FB45DRAFT_875048 [Roridomyces roridus]|uniref:Uncharacterized protein n=1 Tax=Roridomyces roridus TaxID=1738132 RepID=A0AAD7B7C6_9AGAR|nr:hypothetical protein FB45DRAFT_875048 [Roridomyces roridus]
MSLSSSESSFAFIRRTKASVHPRVKNAMVEKDWVARSFEYILNQLLPGRQCVDSRQFLPDFLAPEAMRLLKQVNFSTHPNLRPVTHLVSGSEGYGVAQGCDRRPPAFRAFCLISATTLGLGQILEDIGGVSVHGGQDKTRLSASRSRNLNLEERSEDPERDADLVVLIQYGGKKFEVMRINRVDSEIQGKVDVDSVPSPFRRAKVADLKRHTNWKVKLPGDHGPRCFKFRIHAPSAFAFRGRTTSSSAEPVDAKMNNRILGAMRRKFEVPRMRVVQNSVNWGDYGVRGRKPSRPAVPYESRVELSYVEPGIYFLRAAGEGEESVERGTGLWRMSADLPWKLQISNGPREKKTMTHRVPKSLSQRGFCITASVYREVTPSGAGTGIDREGSNSS